MLTEFISSINWIDILMVGIIVRAIFVGMKTGLFIESFKLLGVVFTVFITYHYYTFIAQFLVQKIHFTPFLATIVAFAILWILVTLIFKLVRDAMSIVFKVQAKAGFDQWIGLVLAIARGILICSLTLMLMYASGIKYLAQFSTRSLSGPFLSKVSLDLYEFTYKTLVSKFFEYERLNTTIYKSKDIEVK